MLPRAAVRRPLERHSLLQRGAVCHPAVPGPHTALRQRRLMPNKYADEVHGKILPHHTCTKAATTELSHAFESDNESGRGDEFTGSVRTTRHSEIGHSVSLIKNK